MVIEALIKVDRLTRYYGDRCAVKDISFTVGQGEILGFLGPNGAGKSTTMQMICGTLATSSGTVDICGHNIAEAPVQAKQNIGYLPERPPVYLDQTVDEYLGYCARLRNVPGPALKTVVDNTKQRCGLTESGHRLIGNLSRGYQQRTGIAQAIIHSPALVILDEPTAGLDPNQILEIRKLISELGQDHSVILSTHILSEAEGVCDRIIIVNSGKLVLDKPVGEIDNLEYTFVKLTNVDPGPEENREITE